MFVEKFGGFGIFEDLLFHHVAPVAAAVSDREKDQFVLLFGLLESFFTPGIPVHGIVFVLLQIG